MHKKGDRTDKPTFMHFCPGTMTTHAEDWTDFYDTQDIEHRTEPVSH